MRLDCEVLVMSDALAPCGITQGMLIRDRIHNPGVYS